MNDTNGINEVKNASKERTILMVDMKGNVAIIHADEVYRFFAERVSRHAMGAYIIETETILKDCLNLHSYIRWLKTPDVFRPPVARPIFGYLKKSKELYGDKAIRFKLGYKADNGFSVPPADTLDLLYSVDKGEG